MRRHSDGVNDTRGLGSCGASSAAHRHWGVGWADAQAGRGGGAAGEGAPNPRRTKPTRLRAKVKRMGRGRTANKAKGRRPGEAHWASPCANKDSGHVESATRYVFHSPAQRATVRRLRCRSPHSTWSTKLLCSTKFLFNIHSSRSTICATKLLVATTVPADLGRWCLQRHSQFVVWGLS